MFKKLYLLIGSKQTEISKKTGYSQAQISHWINGKRRISLDVLQEIAKAYDIEVKIYFKKTKLR